jgi:hypothetical protein
VTVIDYVFGDRAGAYLLGSCLFVLTLAAIAAIVDIPLRTLRDARLAPPTRLATPLSWRLFTFIGLPATLLVFASASIQSYAASTPLRPSENGLVLFFTINSSFVLAVLIWGFASPLTRHWGLGLGAFGLGLAVLFPLLVVVLHLNFGAFGTLTNGSQRLLFALVVGAILCSLGACLAAILSMLVYIGAGSIELAVQHRRHTPRDRSSAPALRPLRSGVPVTPATRRASVLRGRRAASDAAPAKKPGAG